MKRFDLLPSYHDRTLAIALLCRLDPNGVWTDEDSRREGKEPLTDATALQALTALLCRDIVDRARCLIENLEYDDSHLDERGDEYGDITDLRQAIKTATGKERA